MRKAILLLVMLPIAATLMLTACASGPPPTPMPELYPPQSEMQVCEALPPPTSGALTDLLINHLAVARAYHQCRDRHQGLIDWLESVHELP